jgi:DNA polymerase-3 subunit gamma/tau
MRDALSLLDQAIAHGAGRITGADVREMLGAIDETYLLGLLEAVAENRAADVMRVADEMQARSLSFDSALADLAGVLLRIALAQRVTGALDEDLPDRERILALAARLDPESVQLQYEIALQGREDLSLAPDEHAGFVMTMLRMLAFRPEGKAVVSDAIAEAAPGVKPKGGAAGVASGGALMEDEFWPQLVGKLQVTGAARELARNAELVRHDGTLFELVVPKSKAYLAEKSYQDKLKASLEQHFGERATVKVAVGDVKGHSAAAIEAGEREVRQAEATRAVEGDPFVKDLVQLCDAKVVDSSIRATPKS